MNRRPVTFGQAWKAAYQAYSSGPDVSSIGFFVIPVFAIAWWINGVPTNDSDHGEDFN